MELTLLNDDSIIEIYKFLDSVDCSNLFTTAKIFYDNVILWNIIIKTALIKHKCYGCDNYVVIPGESIILEIDDIEIECSSCHFAAVTDKFIRGCGKSCLSKNLYWMIDFRNNELGLEDECGGCGCRLIGGVGFHLLQIKLINNRICCNGSNRKSGTTIFNKTLYQSDKIERRAVLTDALELAGLNLRDDSSLCREYICTGKYDINYVVRRMSEMKYLFDYCHIKSIMNKIKNQEYGYVDDLFDKAEKQILSRIKRYPIKFPWQ